MAWLRVGQSGTDTSVARVFTVPCAHYSAGIYSGKRSRVVAPDFWLVELLNDCSRNLRGVACIYTLAHTLFMCHSRGPMQSVRHKPPPIFDV
jgi:hypothetical protein